MRYWLPRTGTKKVVTLNRPKALNSLNLNMVRILEKHYNQWVQDEGGCIIIKGAGGKAFCAGGDIVAVAQDTEGSLRRDFFMEEYALNYKIKTYPMPHIAFLDGIVMGGGVGLSVHGSHRIVTENTLFAMPETGIGLFPDVGGSIFLPRMPYAGLGMYLALTGYRLKGADALHAAVGTHYVKSEKIAELENELIATKGKMNIVADTIIEKHAEDIRSLPSFSLQPHLDKIARTFTLGSVDDIVSSLKSCDDEWSAKTLKTIMRMSPTSLRATHEQLLRGARQNPFENFQMEARIVYAMMNVSGDFNEGVRALLVDKCKLPKWNPATLEETTPEYMSKFFTPRPDKEWSGGKLTSSL
eukprot:TRINITY_DN17174_c0_g1_i2.p1 TRINITY_DN17174_c0_g1~~TRINITY_DN17174_c0_g1_i2.p1  ORF type:complete len:356 (+),score=97.50 TRINITY_DN17174_c0_g1_i2:105-1172(+)